MTIVAMPTGFSITPPDLPDKALNEWFQLRHACATGAGVRRDPMKAKTLVGVFEDYDHVRAPRISQEHAALGHTGRLPQTRAGAYIRVVDCHGPAQDEYGDALYEHPGVINMAHYRQTERARIALETTAARRFVRGHGIHPTVAPPHIPAFGTNRFRTFDQTPYFEDRQGFISRPHANRTAWNDYQLGYPTR